MTFHDLDTHAGELFLAGRWQPGRAAARRVISPSDDDVVGTVGTAPQGDMEAAVDAVMSARRRWAAAPFDDRTKVLRTATALIEAHAGDYLSLGILTRDVVYGLALAESLPSGIVRSNDQTVDEESLAPCGGAAASGKGMRFGGFEANADAFTEIRWTTAQGSIERYPF